MTSVQRLVTDEQVKKAFDNTNFGEDPRDVIKETLLSIACGYKTSFTAKICCVELGLVNNRNKSVTITAAGKKYLFAAFEEHLAKANQ